MMENKWDENKKNSESSTYKDLISEIWKEKREKKIGEPLPEALYIYIPNPNVSIEEVSHCVLKAMVSTPPEKSFSWSENWGRTKIVLGSESIESRFLLDDSKEAKKTIKLSTSTSIKPEDKIGAEPQGKDYFIILNNQASSIEGIYLQIERMVDELVWCLSLTQREPGKSNIEAHQLAMEKVYKNGFDIYLMEKEALLDLRKKDKRYQVRIYGDVNREGLVPDVIGAVGPFEKCIKPEKIQIPERKKGVVSVGISEKNSSVEKTNFPDKPFVNIGICVAKKPHVGHMLLAGIAEIIRRSTGENSTPMIINANDTGPRIAETIINLSQRKGENVDIILKGLADGSIDSTELEKSYTTRESVGKITSKQIREVFEKGNPILPIQAKEYIDIFSSFLNDPSTEAILESSIEHQYGPQDVLNSPKWLDTGFSYTELQGKRYLLESNNIPTASATRSAVLNFTAHKLNRGLPIFVDSDVSVTDSIDLLKAHVGIEGIQFPGTGIGFEFAIASGTKGNSLPMSEFLEFYKNKYPERIMLEDIVYFLCTRYQIQSSNNLSFFNYANKDAFINDIDCVTKEKDKIKSRGIQVLEKIKELSIPNCPEVKYKLDSKEAKRLDLRINASILTSYEKNIRDYMKKIVLKPIILKETPEVQKLADKFIAESGLSEKEGLQSALFYVIDGKHELQSNIINQLSSAGYKDDNLKLAISNFIEGNFKFVRFNSLLFNTLELIESSLEDTEAMDIHIGELLAKRYKETYEELFKEKLIIPKIFIPSMENMEEFLGSNNEFSSLGGNIQINLKNKNNEVFHFSSFLDNLSKPEAIICQKWFYKDKPIKISEAYKTSSSLHNKINVPGIKKIGEIPLSGKSYPFWVENYLSGEKLSNLKSKESVGIYEKLISWTASLHEVRKSEESMYNYYLSRLDSFILVLDNSDLDSFIGKNNIIFLRDLVENFKLSLTEVIGQEKKTGLIHGDLQGDNILTLPDDKIGIIDFEQGVDGGDWFVDISKLLAPTEDEQIDSSATFRKYIPPLDIPTKRSLIASYSKVRSNNGWTVPQFITDYITSGNVNYLDRRTKLVKFDNMMSVLIMRYLAGWDFNLDEKTGRKGVGFIMELIRKKYE